MLRVNNYIQKGPKGIRKPKMDEQKMQFLTVLNYDTKFSVCVNFEIFLKILKKSKK